MSFELNPAQKKVIAHKKGPLLVVAGAGTGKTRVIVEKIVRLLSEGVSAQSILAVTFTEKAAAEMLERIVDTHGLLPDLPVATFNGYGDGILREFGADIGLARTFRVLGPQAQIVFFRERIGEFELDYFLPLSSSPDAIIEDILKLFSRLKQQLVTPEAYATFAKSLPEGDEAEKLERKKQLELSQAYITYTTLCRKESVIDYDDQVYLLVELLKLRPNVRKMLQLRYHIIFVDEFQDTNPMQSALIDLLVNQDGNVVVVGDDDQSIYGFRGATIQNILSFKTRYPNTNEVALTENYRSRQAILDASYSLIQRNNPHRLEEQLGINKRLTSSKQGEGPELRRFADTAQELSWVADDITRRLKSRQPGEPASIAILTRSNPTALAVHRALELADIEHRVVGVNPDLYSRPVVRMLIELTRTLVEPLNNTSLHHTLVSELFGVSHELIAPLASKARYEHESLSDLLSESKDEATKTALATLNSLRAGAGTLSVGRLLWRAMEATGYKDALLQKAVRDDEAAISIGHVKQFFDSLKEFESIATQPTAAQYLISLPALMAAGETTDDTLEISQDEVIVTTVHKAKGLEWETVYIPYLTEATFPIYPKGKGIQPPEELQTATESAADDHYCEERRIMYVAATRARENLILSFADKGKTGATRKPSRFINELLGEGAAEGSILTEAGERSATLSQPEEVAERLILPASIYSGKTVRLSASQAQALLACPLNFYYKFVLKAPEAPTTSTDYGTQLHALFQEINEGRRDNTLRPLAALLEDLESGWQKAGYSSRDQQQRAFEQAKATLTYFYERALSGPVPLYVEEEFEVQLPGDIALHGRIDAVFEHENGVEIRDYKTGDSVKDEKKALSKVRESTQLTLYALAWQTKYGEIPAKVTLEYPDTKQSASVSKKQQSLDTVQAKLSNAAQALREGRFPPGNGRHDYCIHPELS